ncbi:MULTISPECIES: hypothetical protein [unclassified Variovorax]|uniref:hypothetical protein n=1 Tax=unclassified Variovorax TaxID=663243 RepID=UPI000CC6974A|nr:MULTISPECIES: hypothetical protein [unclassified Variovorax]PNG49153.1 hypothetical protein CHC06_06390 [Variovorax sp. B2]PNG49538.1 hypothetical protein CHC07_06447 [Variovorax sp. B4]VTV18818.1 hypothetical protein WDL1P2_00450 [Variovorax sp. WDL1]
MRLLYVACGLEQQGNRSNLERYPEFVSLCERHIADLDTQADRFHAMLDLAFMIDLRRSEQGLKHLFGQLRDGPNLRFGAQRFVPMAVEIARSLRALCHAHDVEDFEAASTLVDQIGRSAIRTGERPPAAGTWNAFIIRLQMQTEFLEQSQRYDDLRIFTIADDYAMRYALAYFLIDAWLLEQRT